MTEPVIKILFISRNSYIKRKTNMIIAIQYQFQPNIYGPPINRSSIMLVSSGSDIQQKAREYVESIMRLDGNVWGEVKIIRVEPIQNGYF